MDFPNIFKQLFGDPRYRIILQDIKRGESRQIFRGRLHAAKEELIKHGLIKYHGDFNYSLTNLGMAMFNEDGTIKSF